LLGLPQSRYIKPLWAFFGEQNYYTFEGMQYSSGTLINDTHTGIRKPPHTHFTWRKWTLIPLGNLIVIEHILSAMVGHQRHCGKLCRTQKVRGCLVQKQLKKGKLATFISAMWHGYRHWETVNKAVNNNKSHLFPPANETQTHKDGLLKWCGLTLHLAWEVTLLVVSLWRLFQFSNFLKTTETIFPYKMFWTL
jgi:hypothetical protein